MAKAIISNKIYMDADPGLTKLIREKLTYKIKKPPRPGLTKVSMFDFVRNYQILGQGKVLAIPSARVDLIPEDYEIVDKRVHNPVYLPEPKLPLRSDQIVIFDKVHGSCFINAKVGFGKTFLALHIARKLGQKTLIIAHNTFLRDQWVKEVEKLYGFIPGTIGTGCFDTTTDIVIGNIQSLTSVLAKIDRLFGTVIVDEAHHVSAETFTDLVAGMHATYKIGLSGTMQRKDGKHVVFTDFFGKDIYQGGGGTMTPRVKLVNTGITLSPGEPWVRKINNLLYDPSYQSFIATVALKYMELGHKVLIIADRTEFLTNVGELIGEQCVCITGGTTFEERERYSAEIVKGEKSCVVGSRQIFSEGISINPLSCLILASPISAPVGGDGNLEQIVGRIQRPAEGKLQPLVLDMQFAGQADRKQNKERVGFYMRQGWEIVNID